MDTGTHFAFGLGLAGLAYIDPAVAADPGAALAVLAGTVAGSQAPDLDSLLRLKGNAFYIRNHRGLSHSIPAWFVWSALITAIIAVIVPGAPLWHVAAWVLLAVALHVLTDAFNAYGTQAFRPFTKRWIAWNAVPIFDPVIFGAHALCIIIWALGLAAPQIIFPALYVALALYFSYRIGYRVYIERKLYEKERADGTGVSFMLLPTGQQFVWNVVKREQDGDLILGVWANGNVTWTERLPNDRHPAVEASRKHPDVQAFLKLNGFAGASVSALPNGYEVRWIDARYLHRKQYPFVAAVRLNKQLEPVDSYVGWLSAAKLQQRFND